MVVLNICKEIQPICISKKLGLYISNFKDCPFDGWAECIEKEFIKAYEIENFKLENNEKNLGRKIYEHYNKYFPSMMQKFSCFNDLLIKNIINNLVCIYFNYEYKDMPMGGWERNPFDGRLCEKDYAEMIIDFLHFLSNNANCPTWIYSSNNDTPSLIHSLFYVKNDSETKIKCLKEWGEKLDRFLEKRKDYLKLDYLIKAIHETHGFDAYSLFKMYSICQLFLEKVKETELDKKLPQFIELECNLNEKEQIAILLRQMRNKIAHGDFNAFEKKLEEYAKKFMDGLYAFDYSEYSRQNWVLLNICCLLSNIVRSLILKDLEDKQYIKSIKERIF